MHKDFKTKNPVTKLSISIINCRHIIQSSERTPTERAQATVVKETMRGKA